MVEEVAVELFFVYLVLSGVLARLAEIYPAGQTDGSDVSGSNGSGLSGMSGPGMSGERERLFKQLCQIQRQDQGSVDFTRLPGQSCF